MMGNKYELVEIFYSIQGEGARMGTANVFVRFSHCNLSCHFCDTPYNEVNISIGEDQLIEEIKKYPVKNVIFTGGEPTLALKKSLIRKLKDEGYYLAIETNGLKKVILGIDWITVSPKTAMSSIAQKSGSELKIIFGKQKKLENWLKLNFKHFFLSPENDYDKLNIQNNRDVLDYIKINPEWRFTTQIHKVLNIK